MVSFTTTTSCEISEGITKRTAWGSTILNMMRPRRMPRDIAASTWPRGTAFTPARRTSASTPEAASVTGSVIIQKEESLMPYCGTARKKK